MRMFDAPECCSPTMPRPAWTPWCGLTRSSENGTWRFAWLWACGCNSWYGFAPLLVHGLGAAEAFDLPTQRELMGSLWGSQVWF